MTQTSLFHGITMFRKIIPIILVHFTLVANLVLAQDKYAVLIGVETYDPAWFNSLDFAEEDAIELGIALDALGFKTTVMTAQAKTPKLKPNSSAKVLKAIEARANSCGEHDTFLVSLSGHGVQFKDEELLETGIRETYFCPEDADLADKSSLVPISEIIAIINECKAGRKLLLVDSCRNEVVSETAQSKSSAVKIELDSVHENQRSIPGGMSVLFSCSSSQKSWEHRELGHSVFTNYVIDYLYGGADERLYEEGAVDLNGLVYYVSKKTNDFVFENNLNIDGQKPVLRGSSANWKLGKIVALENYEDIDEQIVLGHAKLGILEAQHQLGRNYMLAEKYKEGLYWTRKAADAGYARSMSNMGYVYLNGYGVEKDFEVAREWLEKAAEEDVHAAQYLLGVIYHRGHGVSANIGRAKRWYTKAADQNNSNALLGLGNIYMNGEQGTPKNFEKALEYFHRASKLGNHIADNNIGVLYRNGQGVEKDHEEAMKWFVKANEKDYYLAKWNIGNLYEHGMGVPKSPSKALAWKLESAELGYANAQFEVAYAYEKGLGTPVNFSKAVEWYQKAADLKNYGAMGNLAILYADGNGVPQDYDEAFRLHEIAANEGNNKYSQYHIGTFYLRGHSVKVDKLKAIQWLKKSADNGVSLAQFEVGLMYGNGDGVAQDYSKALKWFKKAADQNHSTANYNVGKIYYDGLGVTADQHEAFSWFMKAAKLGDTLAEVQVGYMYHYGRGTNQNYKTAMSWYQKAAKKNNGTAQFNIGVMCENGEGYAKDVQTAIAWYRKAVANGYKDAAKRLKELNAN